MRGVFFRGEVCFNPRLIQALIIRVLINFWLNNLRMLSGRSLVELRRGDVDVDPRSSTSEKGTRSTDDNDDVVVGVASAKRLVNELNSSFESTMTKSLVLANEEKAAVVAQLESVIRVAALLSKQIEDLSSSLDVANGKVAALGKELGEKSVEARERTAAEKMAETPALLQGRDIRQVDDAPSTSGSSLSSGVGIATTDGAWGDSGKHKYDRQDIKILGFTDRNYLPIAKLWYSRLTFLVSFLHKSVQPSSRLVLAAYSKNHCSQTDSFISHSRDIPSIMLSPTTCKFPPCVRV